MVKKKSICLYELLKSERLTFNDPNPYTKRAPFIRQNTKKTQVIYLILYYQWIRDIGQRFEGMSDFR
jgi:hypothetical protein